MPEFCYRAEDGAEISVVRSRPPRVVRRGGRVYRRDRLKEWAGVTMAAPVRPSLRNRHFESQQAPRWDPDAPRHNPANGKPRFDSQREVDEYVAKKNHKEGGVETRYGELD